MAKAQTPQDRYDAANTRFFGLKLNIRTDADILAALDAAENKQGYIKKALRAFAEQRENGNEIGNETEKPAETLD